MMRSVPLISLFVLVLASCEREQHDYRDLAVGDSKQDVLSKLSKNRVQEIAPHIGIVRVESGNAPDLLDLPADQGLRVGDGKQLDVRFAFGPDQRVSSVTPVGVGSIRNIHVEIGMSRGDAIAVLQNLLIENPGTFVTNFVPDIAWVDLTTDLQAASRYLGQYDTWVFLEPDTHSQGELNFEDGKLDTIEFTHRDSEPL